jgi:hypothetical protein
MSRRRKMLVAASVVAGSTLVIASLFVVVRAWSAACCDPSGIMRGDGGEVAWPIDLDHGDR